MQLVKSGQIANCCQPNAIMTLKEYLEDYAAPETRENGEKVIQRELESIPNEKVRSIATAHLSELNAGKRDFRF
jgi:2-iminoacetate synthase